MVHGFDSISITQFLAMICSVSVEGSLNRVALLTSGKSFLFNLCAFAACLPLSSAQSYLVRFQPLAQSHDIGNQNFVSLHSGFIIIDFDEAADMQCWHYFFHTYIWFGYLVRMTCSRLQELTLVVFFTKFVLSSQPLSKSRSVLPGLLDCWHHLMSFCFALTYLFLAQFDSSVCIRIQFELR